MKIYHLPPEIKALVFDMDLTLYSNAEYGQYQIDRLIEKLGEIRSVSFEKINRDVKEARKAWKEKYGISASLSNILISFGIPMEQIIRWREVLIEPENFIKEDRRLRETLEKLSGHFALGVVTNNPVLVAKKTLAALGIGGFFPIVIGIDTCMVSKPHEKPFLKFAELSGCEIKTCVSIGDRYDVDLDLPLKMGMGGILVDGVEDVYELWRGLGIHQ